MDDEKLYNYQLCRARRVVENAFGILSQRWKIYQCQLLLAPLMAGHIMKATCNLHSYLTQDGDNIAQAMLNDGIEIRAIGFGKYVRILCHPEVRNYFKILLLWCEWQGIMENEATHI